MKNKKIIIPICLLLIAAVVIACVVLIPRFNKDNPPEQTYDNAIIAATPELINPDDATSLENQICGIPSFMFNNTIGRTFDFSIRNNKNNYIFKLEASSKYSNFGYQFTPEDPNFPAFSDPIVITIKPNETALDVQCDYTTPDDIMVFGVLNETGNTITGCGEGTIIYMSYRGSADWTLCGLNTNMSKEDVISKYGEPTQEMDSVEGYRMEYYILCDGHPYILTAMINTETNMVQKIEWLRDNLPVFVNNIVPDDVIYPDDNTHDHDHENETQTTQPTE